jgi:hypothetical protein
MDDLIITARGTHTHFYRDGEWFTGLPGGVILRGYVPDLHYIEPKVLLDGKRAPEGVKQGLFQFTVLHAGWECDDKGWVVEMEDGSKALVLSSHTTI